MEYERYQSRPDVIDNDIFTEKKTEYFTRAGILPYIVIFLVLSAIVFLVAGRNVKPIYRHSVSGLVLISEISLLVFMYIIYLNVHNANERIKGINILVSILLVLSTVAMCNNFILTSFIITLLFTTLLLVTQYISYYFLVLFPYITYVLYLSYPHIKV